MISFSQAALVVVLGPKEKKNISLMQVGGANGVTTSTLHR
jgi:hypothetical protein